MVASYPGTVRVFTTKADITDTVYADHPNSLQDEVIALENTVGINPHVSTAPSSAGSFNTLSTIYSSVAARLANIEIGIVADSHTQYLRRVGGDVIAVGSASTIGLRIRCATSQTADLLQFLDAGGTPVAAFTKDGSLTVNNLTVNGTQTNVAGSATALDLGATTGIAAGTGANFGDKIQLYQSTYGFGVQANRMVVFLPANAGLAIRQKSASGYASGGTDALVLNVDGSGDFTDVRVSTNSLPRGRVAGATVTSQQSGTNDFDITGMSTTWTASAGRRYEVIAHGFGLQSTAAGDSWQIDLIVGANTVMSVRGNCPRANIPAHSYYAFAEVTGLSGSVTAKARVNFIAGSTSGTLTHVAGSTIPARVTVKDVGT